jgi:hypothetical protein
LETDGIRADADYFHTKARQCFRLAEHARDEVTAKHMKRLGDTFEAKARDLEEE